MADRLYGALLLAELASAPLVLLLLLKVTAPYGRHNRPGWGFLMDQKLAWTLMELPAVIVPLLVVYYAAPSRWALAMLLCWQFHYMYRTFVFPRRIREPRANFPLLIALLAMAFNVMNGYINFHALAALDLGWGSWNAPAVAGALIFFIGWGMHFHSDRLLLGLRGPGQPRHAVPRGGLFRWVSSPHYLGEIIQWSGWALMAGTLAGLAFALFTFANLLPRAVANHRWYRQKFPEYPPNRKILIPGIF